MIGLSGETEIAVTVTGTDLGTRGPAEATPTGGGRRGRGARKPATGIAVLPAGGVSTDTRLRQARIPDSTSADMGSKICPRARVQEAKSARGTANG